MESRITREQYREIAKAAMDDPRGRIIPDPPPQGLA
jgi:hypothetical protein